jgi:putative ABC transport system permease protein
MSRVGGWVRVALIDLRGDIRRFTILLTCLALGVGAIAAVSSVGAALQSAIARDARVILGGDLEVRNSGSDVPADQVAYFNRLGAVAEVVDLNARATADDKSVFLSLRAVSDNYPLVGTVELGAGANGAALPDLLAKRDGLPGVVVDAKALDRLGLALGDQVSIGNADFIIRATLKALPDQAAQGFQLGLPALISVEGLHDADLDVAGALTRFRYKIALANLDFDAASADLRKTFPDAAWDIRSPHDATADLARFFDLFSRFLVLVGLSSLLVGGVGVSNAVSAYINERQTSIATLRSLGATSARVLVHFLSQIMLLSLVGIVIGVVLGAASTLIALPILSSMLAIELQPTLDLPSLAAAAAFGILIAFAFALLPLRRAQKLQPASLFRAAGGNLAIGVGWREIVRPRTAVPLLLAFGGIAGLAVLVTGEPMLVLWYGVGALVAFALLRGAAWVLQAALRLIPPLPIAVLRQAIKAIHRPGAPAPVVILSLGLGLALLLMITVLDANLRSQIGGAIADKAPSFVLIDVKKDELPAIEAFTDADLQISAFESVPMLRGTIETVKGQPASELGLLPDTIADMFKGDTALSWAKELPSGSTVAEGKWWAPDYSGDPLISLSREMQEPLGLKLGDQLTISLAGRPITVTIASFRDIDEREGQLNFRLLLSPGLIEKAPQTFMASIKADDGADDAVESRLSKAFPALTFLPVGDALERIAAILASLANAVAIVGSIAVLSGMLVLAGAMAVGRKQREADAVVMKVLGATRRDVIIAFAVEYGILGLLSAVLALILGTTGAWAILTYVLEIPFVLDITTALTITFGAIVLTIVTGMLTTWSAMSVRPARQLRAES